MENNIKVFRVHRALSWLYAVMICAIISLLILMPKGEGGIGIVIPAVILLGSFFLLHHFVAKGAKERKGWAKVTSVIIAIIMLFGFPVGTIIGIYLLINNSGWEASSVKSY